MKALLKHIRNATAIAIISTTTCSAQAQLFANGPDVLVCSVSENALGDRWDQFVFYISGTQRDGSILYKSLTSNPVLVTVDKDGNVSAPNLADCDGKTIQTLTDEGKTGNFQR